jgi:hypothetical protein
MRGHSPARTRISGIRQRRLLLVSMVAPAFALGGLAAAVTAPTPASAQSTMVIDGTGLTPNQVYLYNVGTGTHLVLFNTDTEQSLSLDPGTYGFDQSGFLYDCQVQVTSTGTWSLGSECAGASADGNTLTLSGFAVTVATPGLSTAVIEKAYGVTVASNSSTAIQMMPIQAVNTQVGPGVSPCSFTLDDTGAAVLTAGCGSGANLSSGNTVNFTGFPVSIDGRKLSTNEYRLDAYGLSNTEVPSDVVHDYNLLPNAQYEMLVADGSVTTFYFGVDSSGHWTYGSTADKKFLGGQGTSKLVLKGLTVHVNATAALGNTSTGTYTLGALTFAGGYADSTPENLQLLPNAYGWVSSTGSPASFDWTLDNNGRVALLSPAPACAYGNNTTTLVIDCQGAPSVTEVSGAANPVSQGTSFTVTGTECDRVENVAVTGSISFVDVTTGVSLGKATLGADSGAVNCGQAQVSDSETLSPGTYKIKATYIPAGTTEVPRSASATYSETVNVGS